jgi:hypothetical protein
MFRTATGFIDEWRIILHGPGVWIQAGRQFTEAKAKEHARAVAMKYVHDERREDLPELENLDWQPFTPGEFLNWRS